MKSELDFEKFEGLVPAVIQHVRTRQVLMLGFMNKDAYEQTVESGRVTFWSRTESRLWTKGESSGHFLLLREVSLDCDSDTLLIKAEPQGPVCHTGCETCFGEAWQEGGLFLERLATLISHRRTNPKSGSYTSGLFAEGLDRAAQKVGEEAVEVVIAAKNEDCDCLVNEASDLLFHLLVLLELKGVPFSKIIGRLMERHREG